MRYKREYIANSGKLVHYERFESDIDVDECNEKNGKHDGVTCSWIEETEYRFLFNYRSGNRNTVNENGIPTRSSGVEIKTDTIAPYSEEDKLILPCGEYSIEQVDDKFKNRKGNKRSQVQFKVWTIRGT